MKSALVATALTIATVSANMHFEVEAFEVGTEIMDQPDAQAFNFGEVASVRVEMKKCTRSQIMNGTCRRPRFTRPSLRPTATRCPPVACVFTQIQSPITCKCVNAFPNTVDAFEVEEEDEDDLVEAFMNDDDQEGDFDFYELAEEEEEEEEEELTAEEAIEAFEMTEDENGEEYQISEEFSMEDEETEATEAFEMTVDDNGEEYQISEEFSMEVGEMQESGPLDFFEIAEEDAKVRTKKTRKNRKNKGKKMSKVERAQRVAKLAEKAKLVATEAIKNATEAEEIAAKIIAGQAEKDAPKVSEYNFISKIKGMFGY